MFDSACAECGKTFLSKSKLNQHNNKWHQEMKCDKCGKVFKKGHIARHQKVHTDSVVTCQICAILAEETQMPWTNLDQYKNDICEKTFADRRYLKQFMDKHKGVSRERIL